MSQTERKGRMTEADVAYVRANFVPLAELCRQQGVDPREVRREIEAGWRPRPSYVLEDGSQMVPADYFALADEAGGAERLRALFLRRYAAVAATESEELERPELEWQAYLSGEYGVCLKQVTPETIVRKSALVKRIDGLLASPEPESTEWSAALRAAVDHLDSLERPFAPHYDRLRFGGPSSRDRLITAVRERYPAIFESVGASW